MAQRYKNEQHAGFTDSQRAYAVLDEFCRQNSSNPAEVLVDPESNIARIATFQTTRIKRLFNTFPEVVLGDSTHDTNVNRYKLFSFVVHDVFGKYVHHALVESEHKVNLRQGVEIFKKNNPDWIKIRVALTDKAVHEKDALREKFPDARQLHCQWHVITWLKKQAARLASNRKKKIMAFMRLLVYAKAQGKKKDVITDSLSIDDLLSTLITLKEYAEEQFLAEYHCVRSRPARADEDPELSLLGLQLSWFAFDLISKQNVFATGVNASYKVDLAHPGKVMLTNPRTRQVHEVNARIR
ncbi:hypothetical protein PHMEG_00028830 [Phytophthora megakarya]|uniref:ZSWIM1/3 RNaseH-like domain-containing protein n=1 Tax=Phytophthora megakarya TaxID=4795 RepID=A0A225V422_9STRA|nr:hypothetical protein PHMEG_00028830 [Phytophthora megakarya]